jgi:hypothetical protein
LGLCRCLVDLDSAGCLEAIPLILGEFHPDSTFLAVPQIPALDERHVEVIEVLIREILLPDGENDLEGFVLVDLSDEPQI